MKKNDITYEYRVFTNRHIDVESMEVGRCTSKVVKELKEKDKVDGRFFHTTDNDEWFFCWNGNLQKLNLKGDADVNAALEEVNRLIAEANVAVEEAKKTASEAKDAADAAKDAADNATTAVESINKLEEAIVNKADKGEVEAVANVVKTKQDVISDLNEIRTNADLAKTALQAVPAEYITESDLIGMGYATIAQVNEKQDIISDLDKIRSGAAAGATALQSIPEKYITDEKLSSKGFATTEYVGQQIANIKIPTVPTNISVFTNDAGYLNKSEADKLYAPIGSASDGSGSYATQDFVRSEIEKIEIPTVPTNVSDFINDAGYLTEHQDISGKQDAISDLDAIRSGAAAGATALQPVALNDYYTKGEIDELLAAINQTIGEATELTNTILNA